MREQCQRIALLNDMITRQTAQNVPTLRDTRGLPIHQDSELLASSFPGLLRDSGPGQNAYIMRTKCAQKRECDIFNSSATITYNFDPLKCSHFPVGHSGNRQSKVLDLKSNDPDESGRSQNTPFTTNVATATYKAGPSIRPDNITVHNQ